MDRYLVVSAAYLIEKVDGKVIETRLAPGGIPVSTR